MHSELTIQRKRRNGKFRCRPRRHRYCCIKHAMRQTCIETTSQNAARSGFAWFSSAIPEVVWPAGRDGLPAEAPRYPANPIFGRARPIMGQQPNAAAAASVNPALTDRVNPSFRTARAPMRKSAALSRTTPSTAHDADPGLRRGKVVVTRRHINAFFAISVNSPSMGMVNFSVAFCSAPNFCGCGVTRSVTPQPMRAALRMEAGADACL
jgi:hypothetical protein